MPLRNSIKKLINGNSLTPSEMQAAMQSIMTGQASTAQIAGFIVAVELNGLTVDELIAAAIVMREFATPLDVTRDDLLDIVGTGGDNTNTFNISTTAAVIVAAAGGCVAKHGNRSVSSSSGSADLLEYAGIKLDLTPLQVKQSIEELGLGFLFAPNYHPALKFAGEARKALGIRSFFNLLGPLTNPANAPYLMIGVYDKKWLPLMAKVLVHFGCQKAIVVHSEDGLDEISISASTYVAEVDQKKILYYCVTPEQFGFERSALSSLAVTTPAESYEMMMKVLQNQESPARNIALLNAGVALYVANLADTKEEGVEHAETVLATGQALAKFQQLIEFSQTLSKI